MVDGMVIKVRGRDVDRHIVCRALYRGKGINVLPHRKNDDTARMLSGRPVDSDTAGGNAVDLTASFMYTALLKIILYISVCRLVGKCTDRTRFKCLSLTEDNLRVLMRLTLVLSGEVQVDIRLLISLKSEECLKRDVKALLGKRSAALRADGIRHVTAAASGVGLHQFRVKIAVLAAGVGAKIMCMQRIYLRDTSHRRCEGASDRSTRSNQIPILIRLPHQLLCNDVHNGISVSDNGIKLTVKALLHHRRKDVPVHLMCLVVADITQHLVGISNDRRTFIRTYRGNALTHIRDHVGVGYDDLLRLCRTEILKFL